MRLGQRLDKAIVDEKACAQFGADTVQQQSSHKVCVALTANAEKNAAHKRRSRFALLRSRAGLAALRIVASGCSIHCAKRSGACP